MIKMMKMKSKLTEKQIDTLCRVYDFLISLGEQTETQPNTNEKEVNNEDVEKESTTTTK